MFEFQKDLKTNLHIVDDVSHKRAKYQLQILYILRYKNMIKV
jgi:hypothetical protein